MNPDWKARYETAVSAAQEAGQVALKYFPDSAAAFARRVEKKADDSPVTIADREAEALLRRVILETFPTDGFLGEESGDRGGSSGYRWIVDPIDGTRSFVRGIPLWATLVGLEHRGELIAGVAVEPSFQNTYRALRGDGAFKNDRRIQVSPVDQLAHAMMFACDWTFFEKSGHEDKYVALCRQTQRQRGYSDYFGFVLLAQGAGELMLDHGIHIWDVAALKVLVEEAGGKFTDWDGGASLDRPDVIATNGRLHEQVLAILQAKS